MLIEFEQDHHDEETRPVVREKHSFRFRRQEILNSELYVSNHFGFHLVVVVVLGNVSYSRDDYSAAVVCFYSRRTIRGSLCRLHDALFSLPLFLSLCQ